MASESDTMASMSYPAYNNARDKLRSGWVSGDWTLEDGVCVVQALVDEGLGRKYGDNWAKLETQIAIEIHEVLWDMSYRYRRFARRGYDSYNPPQSYVRSVIRWNDARFTRHKHVIELMDRLVAKSKQDWLEGEHKRLTLEVAMLQEQIIKLHARVAELETKNASLWKRVKSADKDQLAALETELAQKWEDLTSLQEHAIV